MYASYKIMYVYLSEKSQVEHKNIRHLYKMGHSAQFFHQQSRTVCPVCQFHSVFPFVRRPTFLPTLLQ